MSCYPYPKHYCQTSRDLKYYPSIEIKKDELEEYFTPPQSLDCNENGGLKSNMEDQYSHKKMLQNGKWDVIENLEEQFNEHVFQCIREIVTKWDKM